MIGNKIEFLLYDGDDTTKKSVQAGLVVDAFTELTMSAKERFKSKRKYKVEYFEGYNRNTPKYIDIFDWQLVRILTYGTY